MRVLRTIAVTGTVAALWAAPAMAGQIVFEHGSDIWVMNDDGSNGHALITVPQVPGMTSIGEPQVFANGGTKVTFVGTTTANDAPIGTGPAGACGINCEGLYTFDHGTVTRLSGAPAPCGGEPQFCATFDTNPSWMANGNIAYERSVYSWEYSCLSFPCTWEFNPGSIDEVDQIPPSAGSLPGTKFPEQNTTGLTSTVAPITDPADATKIAYIGSTVNCATQCLYPLYYSTGSGTDTPVAYDDALEQAAWSADGSQLADIEGGDKRGIWIYPANGDPNKTTTWALNDPIQTGADPGNSTFDTTFSHIGWIGSSKIIFSANDNLWTIPATCGQQNGTPCQFPQDATQVTHDGTDQSRNLGSSWTSTTASLEPAGNPGGGNGGGGNGGGGNGGGNGGGDPISKVSLASSSVKTGKTLTIEVTLSRASKVLVRILRFVPASGHGKHHKKAHYSQIGTLAPQGSVGLNKFRLAKLHGHKLKPGKYELLISAGGKVDVVKFTVRA